MEIPKIAAWLVDNLHLGTRVTVVNADDAQLFLDVCAMKPPS
jgi:hypothetical protein